MRALPARRTLRLAKKSRGFTLIELALVATFLGMLMVFAVSQFSGSASDTTRANGLYEAAQKIAQNWTIASARCALSPRVDISPLGSTPSAANTLSVLLGTQPVNPPYAACFSASGARPLYGLTSGPTGSERVFAYPVSLSSTGPGYRQLIVQYNNVPESLALPLFQKHSGQSGAASAGSVPTSADSTDLEFRFSAQASDGTRTIMIVVPI